MVLTFCCAWLQTRGLGLKYWAKYRATQRAVQQHEALQEHEARLAAAAIEEDEDDEATGEAAPAGRKRPRINAMRREQARRAGRRHARDAKCFRFDDPVEVRRESVFRASIHP